MKINTATTRLFFLIILIFCTKAVLAKTYTCEAVDEVARLHIKGSTVAITADSQNKICSFSVDGEEGNTSRELYELMVQIEQSFNGPINDFMSLAGDFMGIPNLRISFDGEEAIGMCIKDLMSGRQQSQRFDFDSVECRVVVNERVEYNSIKISPDEQVVMFLFLESGTQTHLLAIPRRSRG